MASAAPSEGPEDDQALQPGRGDQMREIVDVDERIVMARTLS